MTRRDQKPEQECRAHGGYRVLWSVVGRTKVELSCPFCQAHVEAYLWSLAGSGKKCPCGALLTQRSAWKAVSGGGAAEQGGGPVHPEDAGTRARD